MTNNEHLIRRIDMRVNAHGNPNPFYLRSRAEQLCSRIIPARLEKILSSFNSDEVIELPSIQFNFQGGDWNQIELKILDQCCKEVEWRLREFINENKLHQEKERNIHQADLKDGASKKHASIHSAADVFFHYLNHGTLPWWGRYITINQLEENFIQWLEKMPSPSRRESLLVSFRKLSQLPNSLIRLVNQFSGEFQARIIGAIDEKAAAGFIALQGIFSEFFDTTNEFQIPLRHIRSMLAIKFFGRIIHEDRKAISRFENLIREKNELKSFIEKLLQKNTASSISPTGSERELRIFLAEIKADERPEKKIPEKKEIPANEGNEYFIHNAGLIILHPFIEMFFRSLQLLDEDGNFKEYQIHKAIHLLQYLCTGDSNQPEFKMILNKILCGMPIEFPLGPVQLTEEEKAACDELLQAVIKHWTALKNTSQGALQDAFMLREGKLAFKEYAWWLKVEQKTEDILLDRLPWGISRIKLPWMKEWLRVAWNS